MPSICVAQFSTGQDKADNRTLVAKMICDAATDGAELVVLPEFSMYNAPTLGTHTLESAESFDGPFVTLLRAMASEQTITVVAGMTQAVSDDDKHVSNTLVAVDPSGEIVATYRKLHLFDAFGFQESEYIKAGQIDEDPELFEVSGLRFGMQTCFDVRFPEVTRRIAEAGADVVLLPTAWLPGPRKESQLRALASARAIENTVYVAASDQVPPQGAACAMIIDPSGTVISDVGNHAGRALANLNRATIDRVRGQLPALDLRRFAVTARETGNRHKSGPRHQVEVSAS
ncbi:carbon-nitrogen hydrolase family protein [Rhodococcus sp. NPDC055024]